MPLQYCRHRKLVKIESFSLKKQLHQVVMEPLKQAMEPKARGAPFKGKVRIGLAIRPETDAASL